MSHTVLFDDGTHRNVMLEDSGGAGLAVQANQHVIVHGGKGMILDPGGHKVYSKVLAKTFAVLGNAQLQYLFLSHQDPDIVAAVNGWLMTTDAEAWISAIWVRFVAHFGVDHMVESRLKPIPDEGMVFDLAGAPLICLPAHFMHSEGNFQIYDPTSKILYTGDLGASIGMDYTIVPDFDAHLRYMEKFHQRYMVANSINKAWAKMVRGLEIDMIAPQHGAIFKGREMCTRFIDWIDELQCGIDLITPMFKVPAE